MFDQIVDGASAAIWNLRPSAAVALGRHEYDGLVPDLEEEAVGLQLDRLHLLRGRLAGLERLDPDQGFDREHLAAAIEGELLRWEGLRWWRRNPMEAIGHLDVTAYLTRDFAPITERAEGAAAALDQSQALLEQARRALQPPVPRVYCEWAVRQAVGMADSLVDDLPAVAATEDPAAGDLLAAVGRTAAGALRDYAAWIETDLLPAATEDFAVGGEILERMVRRGERLELRLEDLLAAGEADLAANAEAFRSAAALIDPAEEPTEVYRRHVTSEYPSQLVPAVRATLDTLRSFIDERDLVEIPTEVHPVVAETPRHLRWAFAMIVPPGPYESPATGACYFLTPPEPGWTDDQAAEWMQVLNSSALEAISIHEAYPGHYVQFLHSAAAPTEVAKRFASDAFVEGWAHYAEQMMWEEGYREGDPRFRLAQLAEALIRNCRLVCAIRMHALGMGVDEAARFFETHSACRGLPALREAERGTFDPGYFCYTLGKLEIVRLRDEAAAAGPGFELRRFHDRLLSRGAPPIGMLSRLAADP